MSKGALDLFGRILMTKVRDKAVVDWRKIVDGSMKGEMAEKNHDALASFSEGQRKVFLSLVPSVVDTVLHHLLWTLEQQQDVAIHIRVDGEDVQDLKEISDGLPGELYSTEGWIARFSGVE